MRRLWLTLLTAFALAASGLSSAFAAQDCAMRQAAPVVSAHDCCPQGQSDDRQPQTQKMDGCMIGMACRSAPAIAPTLEPIRLSSVAIFLSQPLLGEPAPPSGPLQELFRPPRNI
jgi:hypothetical protein